MPRNEPATESFSLSVEEKSIANQKKASKQQTCIGNITVSNFNFH